MAQSRVVGMVVGLGLVASFACIACGGAGGSGDLVAAEQDVTNTPKPAPAPGAADDTSASTSKRASDGSSSSPGAEAAAATKDPDAMFASPAKAPTPGTLRGIWRATSVTADRIEYDMRMRFGDTSFAIAARCQKAGVVAPIAYVSTPARMQESTVEYLDSDFVETKNGAVTCSVFVDKGKFERCDQEHGLEEHCYVLDGTRLVIFYDSALNKEVYTKISD